MKKYMITLTHIFNYNIIYIYINNMVTYLMFRMSNRYIFESCVPHAMINDDKNVQQFTALLHVIEKT